MTIDQSTAERQTKRILFVANVAKEHIIKFHIPTIKMLSEMGWIVDVACSGDDDVPYCHHQFKTCWKRSPFSFKTVKGIKQLKRIINANQYDVIYCHTPVGGLIGRLAAKRARKRGTKVVYFVHGFHFYKGAPIHNWLFYYPIERYLARFTDKMITINPEDEKNAKQLLRCNNVIRVNGMGIDVDFFRSIDKAQLRKSVRTELKIPEDAWVLIYLAELSPNKNQKMLVDAFEKVHQYHHNSCLILAGVDHYDGKIQRYVEEKGLKDNFRYLGWRSDKEALYAAADICTPTSIREGFGLNLVEAMAVGLPIVATKNRGHETIIKNSINGFLVDINDYNSMATIVIDSLSKHIIFKQEDLDKYDTQKITKRILEYVTE